MNPFKEYLLVTEAWIGRVREVVGWERWDGLTIVSDPPVSSRLVVFLERGASGTAEETDSIAD